MRVATEVTVAGEAMRRPQRCYEHSANTDIKLLRRDAASHDTSPLAAPQHDVPLGTAPRIARSARTSVDQRYSERLVWSLVH